MMMIMMIGHDDGLYTIHDRCADYNNKCILPTAGSSYLKIGGIAAPPVGDNGGAKNGILF